jgi:hypothetical protein
MKLPLKALFLTIACFTLLYGCGPVYETSYSFKAPKDSNGAMCVMQCSNTKQLCRRLCSTDDQNCKEMAHEQARFEYEAYLSKQRISGLPINRDLNSFYDPLQCSRSQCHCEEDYRACYSMCGGKVITHKKCVAFCGEH